MYDGTVGNTKHLGFFKEAPFWGQQHCHLRRARNPQKSEESFQVSRISFRICTEPQKNGSQTLLSTLPSPHALDPRKRYDFGIQRTQKTEAFSETRSKVHISVQPKVPLNQRFSTTRGLRMPWGPCAPIGKCVRSKLFL